MREQLLVIIAADHIKFDGFRDSLHHFTNGNGTHFFCVCAALLFIDFILFSTTHNIPIGSVISAQQNSEIRLKIYLY